MSSRQQDSRPDRPESHIPRFLWRVESRNSRNRVLESAYWYSQTMDCTRKQLRSYISAHMISRNARYLAPFIITSFTGSLLWALNYAHWLLSEGETDIKIVLLDAWSALDITQHIHPARYLSARLKIPPVGKPWHDNPYHEYFVIGDFPLDAVLGFAELKSAKGRYINTLLPEFSIVDRREGLLASLFRFQNSILDEPLELVGTTKRDLRAAWVVASKFLKFVYTPNPDIHFQLAMMFLALRNRDWYEPGFWPMIRDVFQGARIPHLFLYKSLTAAIDPQMPDVERWVRGMVAIRFKCASAHHLALLDRESKPSSPSHRTKHRD